MNELVVVQWNLFRENMSIYLANFTFCEGRDVDGGDLESSTVAGLESRWRRTSWSDVRRYLRSWRSKGHSSQSGESECELHVVKRVWMVQRVQRRKRRTTTQRDITEGYMLECNGRDNEGRTGE